MKHCTSCGKELRDNAKFCTVCGTKCSEDPEHSFQAPDIPQEPSNAEVLPHAEPSGGDAAMPTNNATPAENTDSETPISQDEPEQHGESVIPAKGEKKPLPKGKIILFSILGAVLIAAIIFAILFFRWYTSTEQQIFRALDSEDYDAAIVIMEEDVSARESKALVDQLKERIANIKNGFIDGTIEYATATMELNTIKKLKVDGVSSELKTTQDYIDDLNESRTNFATAESFYTTGDYAEAITYYRMVIEEDANYPVAVEKLADTVNKYREEILTKAAEYADSELYTEAIAVLNEALTIVPDEVKITAQLNVYAKDNAKKLKAIALETAEDFAQQKNYLNAYKTIAQAIATVGEDTELSTKAGEYERAHVTDVSAQVDSLIENNDISSAKDLLQKARKEFPNNTTVTEMWEEILQYKSVSVRSLTPINSDGTWNETNVKLQNALGETFPDATNFFIPNQGAYGEYYINGQYTMVTGNLTSYHGMSQGRICSFQIWADNTILYVSPVITQKTKQFSFAVVIPQGTQNIKFVCAANGWSCSEILLTDLFLWNDPHYYDNHPSDGSVAVRSLTPINTNGSWNDIPLIMENALGDSLAGAQSFFIPYQDSYGEYYINGQYSRVSGNITSYTYMGEDRECTFQILADDKIIYTSPTITQTTKQISFDITLPEGTQFVKFLCIANGYSCSEIFITELFLWE